MPWRFEDLGTRYGSFDIYTLAFRKFLRNAHRDFFDLVVREIWLEQQFEYKGRRRVRRYANGHLFDSAFSFFMRSIVGVSQKPLTQSIIGYCIVTYLHDFFPDFLAHDPFKQPEEYRFPFKKIGLDHLFFVYECEDRLEMLAYAEKRSMSYAEFANWAYNHVRCYNKEVGKDIYSLSKRRNMCYIKNAFLPRSRQRYIV